MISAERLVELRDRFDIDNDFDRRDKYLAIDELLAARARIAELEAACKALYADAHGDGFDSGPSFVPQGLSQEDRALPENLLDAAAIADQRDTLLGLVVVAEELLREAPLPSHKAIDEWVARRDHYLREREAPYAAILRRLGGQTT